jgi:Zn-dependent M16 (insulinase) family peptidase
LVEISWAGPPAKDLYTIRALMILSNYLTDTAGAPLKKDFVQIEDPFCSSVHISLMEQTDCELIATFEGVPVNKLEKIQDRYIRLFKNPNRINQSLKDFLKKLLRIMLSQHPLIWNDSDS